MNESLLHISILTAPGKTILGTVNSTLKNKNSISNIIDRGKDYIYRNFDITSKTLLLLPNKSLTQAFHYSLGMLPFPSPLEKVLSSTPNG